MIWSFIGFSNANYAMQEIKNPVRTLRIAGPLAIGVISVLYMLANIAYFAAVPKEDILKWVISFFRYSALLRLLYNFTLPCSQLRPDHRSCFLPQHVSKSLPLCSRSMSSFPTHISMLFVIQVRSQSRKSPERVRRPFSAG